MEHLKRILNKNKTPNRIFDEIARQPYDILRLTAVCIAHRIIKFSSHQSQLSDILRQFEEYPAKTTITDMLLCKRRLSELGAIKHRLRRESDWEYWQGKTNQACILAFNNLYQIVKGENEKAHFERFVEQAAAAYGFAESMRQMKAAQKQTYDFGDPTESKLLETQKYNTLRAHRSHINALGVAKVEFLRALREEI